MDKLISIIVPIYNTEEYLVECIESIIAQTYKKLEIILVDDGSTDQSGKICDKYAKSDNRVKVIHKKNQGLVAARQTGLENASSEIVGFVDSDDWIDAEMYEYLTSKMEETGADVVTSGRYVEGAQSLRFQDAVNEGLYHPKEDRYFCRNMILGKDEEIWGITPNYWNKLFKKKLIMPYVMNLDRGITYGEDDACVYPCMAFSDSVYVSSEVFYHYRLRENSMSQSGDDKYLIKVNLLYLAMRDAYLGHPLAKILYDELRIYMFEFVLRGINGLWEGTNSNRLIGIPRATFDVNCILSGKVMLYGAGNFGKEYYRQIEMLGIKKNVVWVDKRYSALQKQGFPVEDILQVDPKTIKNVIVGVSKEVLVNDIVSELVALGYDRSIIHTIDEDTWHKNSIGAYIKNSVEREI